MSNLFERVKNIFTSQPDDEVGIHDAITVVNEDTQYQQKDNTKKIINARELIGFVGKVGHKPMKSGIPSQIRVLDKDNKPKIVYGEPEDKTSIYNPGDKVRILKYKNGGFLVVKVLE